MRIQGASYGSITPIANDDELSSCELIWKKVAGGVPVGDFTALWPEAQRSFTREACTVLGRAEREAEPELIRYLIKITENNHDWLTSEIADLGHRLVKKIVKSPRPVSGFAERTYQLLLLTFADENSPVSTSVQKILVEAALKKLSKALKALSEAKEPAHKIDDTVSTEERLAVILAAWYGSIISRHQRVRLVELIDSLRDTDPRRFDDPFLNDLLAFYNKLNLKQLEYNHERWLKNKRRNNKNQLKNKGVTA